MDKNRGFTLIELIITIAVLGIMTTMAAPSFTKIVAQKKLDISARNLSLIFGESRAKATALRRDITIKFECKTLPNTPCVDTSTTFYWLSNDPNIVLTGDKTDVQFSAVGLARRIKQINNPKYEEDNTQPEKIDAIVPMKFELCNSSLNESRTVVITKLGTVDVISAGTCS